MDSEAPSSGRIDLRGAGIAARRGLYAVSGAAIAFSVWLLGWRMALALSVGLLVHEFGHALATWLYTRKFPAMVLIPPFFGLTFALPMAGRPANDVLAMKMAGIWFSLLVCLGLLPFAGSSDLLYAGIAFSLVNNGLNLLPIPGLDGGAICLHLIRGRSLPGRLVVTLLMLSVGVLFAVWAATTFVWIVLGLNAVMLGSKALRLPKDGDAPELSRGAVLAWVGAQALTFTVLAHIGWVLLSLGSPMVRISGMFR